MPLFSFATGGFHRMIPLVMSIALSLAPAAGADDRAWLRDRDIDSTITSAQAKFNVDIVATEIASPWGLAFLPDGRALITQRGGGVLLLDEGQIQPIADAPETEPNGQGGLLDVALDPDFAANRWVYFSLSNDVADESSGTRVVRAKFSDNPPRLSAHQVIFQMNRGRRGGRHFGSRLLFLPDDTLLVSIGDRGERDWAQSLRHHAGSIVRINRDGSVPADNPFVDNKDALGEIYSYGHRNPQGLDSDADGNIWSSEFGPQGGDEINIIKPGLNYGWPVATYGREYVTGFSIGEGEIVDGTEQPATHWTPSISPSGIAFYQGDAFGEWRGDLFVTALSGMRLVRLEIDGTRIVGEESLLSGVARFRAVKPHPDGSLYLLVDGRRAPILRLTPAR